MSNAAALGIGAGIGVVWAAPDFKTGMILWLGGPLGIGVAQPFTVAVRAFRKSP